MQAQFEPTTIEDPARRGAAAAQGWLSRVLRARKPWAGWSIGALVAWIAVAGYAGTEPEGPSASFIFFCLGITVLYYVMLLMVPQLAAVTRRAADEQKGHIDHGTTLYNRAGLIAEGDELLAACRRDHRNLSVAVFDCSDLLEVRSIYGNRTGRQLLERIVRKLSAVAGERGLAARTGPAEFTLVLPLGRDKARQAIRRALGSPARIELDAGDSEIVLVPDLAVESASRETKSAVQLYQSACREMARMKQDEQRRQNYLQRERESHSRPMSLPFPQDVHAPRKPRKLSRAEAKTMPAPLPAN